MPSSASSRSRTPAHASPRRRWTGVPAADRKAERRGLLLDAAYELLGTEGWSGTTVRAVHQRAGLHPRYFYESFADLDELVIAVYDRVVDELRVQVLAALDSAPAEPRALLEAAVRRTVEFVDEDRRRARVMYVEALGNEALNRRRLETAHSVAALIETYSASRHGALPAGEHVGHVAAAVFVGGFSEVLVDWLAGRLPIGREQLIEDSTALFLALGDAAADVAARRRRSKPGAGSSSAAKRGARANRPS